METVTKQSESNIVEMLPGSREVVAVINSASVDRDNEVVLPSGCRRKNYAGMPVFFNHAAAKTGPDALPVAVCQWVKACGDQLLAKHRFSDRTELARDCFALVQEGALKSYSIGFLPLESPSAPSDAEIKSRPGWKSARRVYRDWELLEYSLVGIPANPDAVQVAVAKGLCSASLGDALAKASNGAISLHEAAEAHVKKLIGAGKVDRMTGWSFTAEDEHACLQEAAGDWEKYARNFLGVRQDADKKTFGAYAFPVIKGGKVFVAGLRAAIERAAQHKHVGIEIAARTLLKLAEGKKSLPTTQESLLAQIAIGTAERLRCG